MRASGLSVRNADGTETRCIRGVLTADMAAIRDRPRAPVGAFAALLALACIAARSARPSPAPRRRRRSARPADTPAAPVPEREQSRRRGLQAVGSVTGFQMMADGTRAPFKVREAGTIVAWASTSRSPNRSEHKFFADFYEPASSGPRRPPGSRC